MTDMPKEIWLLDDNEPEYTHSSMAHYQDPRIEDEEEYGGELIHKYIRSDLYEREREINHGCSALYRHFEEQLKTKDEALKTAREAFKELIFLNDCEMEGIQSGMPTPQQWLDAFDRAQEALTAIDRVLEE